MNVVDIYTLQSYPTITSSKTWTLVGQTTVTGQLQLNSPGSLGLGSYNLNVGSMSGNAPIDLSTGTLTTGSDNTNTNYAGNISDAGTLVKIGSGTLVLSGSNTYSGGTTINAGTLMAGAVNTLSPNSAFTIDGGVLDITAGSQAIASLTMNSSGSLNLGIGNGPDLLILSGTGTLNGTLDVTLLNGFTPVAGDVFDLFSGTTTGSFSQINLPSLGGGLRWNTSELYSAGEVSVVPEPGTLVLLGAGALVLGFHNRRRKHSGKPDTVVCSADRRQADDLRILSFPACSFDQANVRRRAA